MSADQHHERSERRGAVLVYVAFAMFALLGFGALGVDLGFKFVVRTDLQNATDAAALAAAGALATEDGTPYLQRGRDAAILYAAAHTSVGMNDQGLILNPADVVYGDAVFDAPTRRWFFSAPSSSNRPYGVEVTLRRDGTNNPTVPYFFGRIFNMTSGTQFATSRAMVAPRDIVIAMDLSRSMTDDSLLVRRNAVQINLRDLWVTLEDATGSPSTRTVAGNVYPTNYILRTETASAYAAQNGRTFGSMTNWGTAIVQGQYNQTAVEADLGMYNLPQGQAWNTATTLGTGAASPRYAWLVTNTGNPRALVNRNTQAQINVILGVVSPSGESVAQYQNRVKVVLGLSNWTSDANANNRLDNNEVTVFVDEPYNLGAGWNEWIDYVRSGYDSSYFTNRYGLKAYVNWLADNCYGMVAGAPGSQGYTPRLQFTPITKLQGCKDAILGLALALQGVSNEPESSDRVGMVVFGSRAFDDPYTAANGLTSVFERIADLPFPHQPGDRVGPATNTPEALTTAMIMLQGPGSRPFAHKMIVLLTDGLPTVWNHYNIVNPSVPANRPTLAAVTTVAQFRNLFGGVPSSNQTGGSSQAQTETLNVARIITSGYLGLGGAEIIPVGVGSDANEAFLNQIAALSGGTAYMAVPDTNDPTVFASVLLEIFEKVASQRPIALIK